MFFAFATLFLHLAVPAAAANAATAAAAKAPSLPDAPLPSRAAATDSLPASQPAPASTSNSATSGEPRMPVSVLRASAMDTTANSQVFSTIRIPETNNKETKRIEVNTDPSRRQWLALAIAQHSAAGFDAYATRRAISNGAYEADPTMRLFAGSPAIYGAIQVCPLAVDYVARRMKRSESPVLRHTWWLPQAVGTGVYIFSGVHDLHVASQMHQ